MTFPQDIADHHKENLKQKCFYVVNLFKHKDLALYEKYKARLETLDVKDSWDFYHELIVEYQKLADKPDLPSTETPQAKAPAKSQKPQKKEKPTKKMAKIVKKAPAKKVAKKAAKKTAKKTAKKVVKKSSPKKAAKKIAAKKTTKIAKKTVKKATKKKR